MKAVHGVLGAVDSLYFCGKLRKNLIYCHMLSCNDFKIRYAIGDGL